MLPDWNQAKYTVICKACRDMELTTTNSTFINLSLCICLLPLHLSCCVAIIIINLDHMIIQPALTSEAVWSLSALMQLLSALLWPLPLHCTCFHSTVAASAPLRPLSVLLCLLSAPLQPLCVKVQLCSEYVPKRSALMGHLKYLFCTPCC